VRYEVDVKKTLGGRKDVGKVKEEGVVRRLHERPKTEKGPLRGGGGKWGVRKRMSTLHFWGRSPEEVGRKTGQESGGTRRREKKRKKSWAPGKGREGSSREGSEKKAVQGLTVGTGGRGKGKLIETKPKPCSLRRKDRIQ